MAEICPFRALRFTPVAGEIEELTCPPYDIISEEQRLEYLSQNPHNIIRLELPRDGQEPYSQAGETLRRRFISMKYAFRLMGAAISAEQMAKNAVLWA